jgi:hypothetical protein
MIRKALFAMVGLVGATVGPIAYFSAPGYWKAVGDEWFSSDDSQAAGEGESAASGEVSPTEGTLPASSSAGMEGQPVGDLAEVLRFDVTPGWVMQRWPRVSTGLAHLQFQGYRVPLVTGTGESDLAGALTYYFNSQQKVQLITFHGTTGNARRLVEFLTSHYGFARRLTNNPGLFLFEAAGRDGRKSVLRIVSSAVVKSSDSHGRFSVDMVLERPE